MAISTVISSQSISAEKPLTHSEHPLHPPHPVPQGGGTRGTGGGGGNH